MLSVQNPPVDTTTGRKTDGGTTLVLDLLPEDASQLVFSTTKAQLYLGLLPPENEDGYETEGTVGVPLDKVVGVGGDRRERRHRRDAAVLPPAGRAGARGRGG